MSMSIYIRCDVPVFLLRNVLCVSLKSTLCLLVVTWYCCCCCFCSFWFLLFFCSLSLTHEPTLSFNSSHLSFTPTTMRSSPLLLCLLCCGFFSFQLDAFEDEFSVRGPGALHQAALDVILEERRANISPGERGGAQKDAFSEESDLMKRAKEYAIHRFMTKSDEALKASVSRKHGVLIQYDGAWIDRLAASSLRIELFYIFAILHCTTYPTSLINHS